MSSEERTDAALERARAVLRAHREELLRLQGVTAVGIGFKMVAGTATDRLAIVVSVREKRRDVPPGERIPAELDGVPTDVVEEVVDFARSSTNPMERFDPLISGIAVGALVSPTTVGSVGCFFYTPGDPGQGIPAGDYLLTCQHVLDEANTGLEPEVIQPATTDDPVPESFLCGRYEGGIEDATHDCAIVSVEGRKYRNEVPNYPRRPGNRDIRGLAVATLGQAVYKYGVRTKFTEGVVDRVDYSFGDVRETIRIQSSDGPDGVWAGKGDSGSVSITQDGDLIIGLNFGIDGQGRERDPSPTGYAYPIYGQMNEFSATGGIRLSGQ